MASFLDYSTRTVLTTTSKISDLTTRTNSILISIVMLLIIVTIYEVSFMGQEQCKIIWCIMSVQRTVARLL